MRDFPPNPTWAPLTTTALNSYVEPTTYTGFAYKAVAVEGANPHTSSTEPTWPTTAGAVIQEFGDFDLNSNDIGSTSGSSSSSTAPVPLGSTITDRYGNSSDVSGAGTPAPATTIQAAPTVTDWMPGTTYAPGAVVKPTTNQGAFINAIPNGDFEDGNDGNWILSNGDVTIESTKPYQGSYDVRFALNHDTQTCTMNNYGTVTPGQSVTASAYLDPSNSGANLTMWVNLRWYTSADAFISQTQSAGAEGGGYRQVSVTGTAPAGAAHCRVQIEAATGTSPNPAYADLVVWSLEQPAAVSNFLFEAIQSKAASSGSTQPNWPTIEGDTVVDGGVTWQAVGTSIITWQAIPLMYSGTSAPTFPTVVGISVNDPSTFKDLNGVSVNTSMSWKAIARNITDTNDPNTIPVCLGASHVFAGNDDICSYSAAVDPTDWSSANNAGYLPTGLNNYGNNPVAMLALYRSNLMVFNAGGYQMWQIDPDPANMALLDAQPVGSIYTRAAQSVANDLLFLTEVGVRNIGTTGATANMQVGNTGQPIDPLIKAQLQAGTYKPISLYYPGRGQYWLFFGPQAYVLTINGAAGTKSWSRYIFPDTITDWTLNAGVLYLRTAGNLVWQFDQSTLVDDYHSGSGTEFVSTIQWPYLDMGTLGFNKMLVGVDLVGTGEVTIQVAFNQADNTTFSDNASFSSSLNVTAPYVVAAEDTVPGQPLPIPINAPSYSLILSFESNQPGLGAANSQSWEWDGANLYVTDAGSAGITG